MRRRDILISLIGATTLALGACSSGESGSAATPVPTSASAAATTLASTLPAPAAPDSTEPPTTTLPATTTLPPTTTSTEPPTTTTTLPPIVQVDPPLHAVGNNDGEETARIQARLLELGFWNAGADGDYGLTTTQAVMAFQKYIGIEPTGKVNQVTADFLTQTTERAKPSDESATRVEVNKDKQLLFIVYEGRVVWTLNISTGSGQYYVERNQKDPTKYESGRSVTRTGDFDVYRERAEGWWEGDLGKIYRPKYVSGGIAIHGSNSVPNYPASHGCIRVSVPAMDMIWDSGLVPKGFPVTIFGDDPEPTGPKPTVPEATTTVPPEVPPESVAPEPPPPDQPPAETTTTVPAETPVATEAPVTAAPETAAPADSAPPGS